MVQAQKRVPFFSGVTGQLRLGQLMVSCVVPDGSVYSSIDQRSWRRDGRMAVALHQLTGLRQATDWLQALSLLDQVKKTGHGIRIRDSVL